MKEFIETYKQHQEEIEFFLQESVRNLGSLKTHKKNEFSELFNLFPSLELIYFTNKDTKIQTSPNYYRSKVAFEAKDKNRSYLISKLEFKGENIAFSTPYISIATRNNCVTLTIKEDDEIIFLDFRIDILLEKLNLLELNKPFHAVTKGFYIFAGFSMMALAIITIVFSLYDFIYYLFIKNDLSLEMIFKPIIALTLSIAIFDLAKTILEQEVFFKSYSKNSKVETKILTKFLSTIIIALSIEALIVVFKIALNDYDKMINAFYLIAGISLILISLTAFTHFSGKKNK
ncbi:hypothetical protein [Poseidonibacter ostreae]|jgi:hypothetical protein|uniref:General glycosylation pathway protein n=1 Tax=Poseidonibacter ostreae TaxID=2654171 RepID=A0A6L4WTI1_9BACT|nr:hypothetical protein [Poseidonibacter ostreae]KAB7885911.1 hypothetical protein GA417_06905 [Poseidonibacter ostreae]KAB7889388.1 hypothetical protein GBG19_06285 [Poseidonibacter ostreae]KAB7891664.1 hypothetical protein GBG18_06190 [Poseidonibacter ostreae]MAC83986.1 hypothetical protein [Arcobacter sp.]|tara:strand:+ start:1579 stop:2442 length:864 start_codon:yes stop_codon:yes gene_type:complete